MSAVSRVAHERKSALVPTLVTKIDADWEEGRIAPLDVVLAGHQVHIWRSYFYDCAAELNVYWSLLAPVERARALRFRFERHRTRFILGRGILRVLLARYLGVRPHDIAFVYSSTGKPSISGFAPISFSVSHTDNLCVFSFGRAPHGIDVEEVRANVGDAFINYALSVFEEFACSVAQDTRYQDTSLFTWWTQNEAYFKALGKGHETSSHAEPVTVAKDWTFFSFTPDTRHIGALCVRDSARNIRFLTYRDLL